MLKQFTVCRHLHPRVCIVRTKEIVHPLLALEEAKTELFL